MKFYQSGKQLIDDVSQTEPGNEALGIWWLGQHSYILKLADQIIYIDPFLTPMEERLVPAMFRPEECVNADLIIGSHDHADHIDRPVWPGLSEVSAGAKFIVPEILRESLIDDLKIDANRFIGMDDGKTIEHQGVRITGIAAAHEFLDRDEETGRYPYLGFVIEAAGLTIYFAGDTCIYEGLISKLREWKFDLMLLPINGRDADKLRRDIVGNMTYQEAVDLAGTLATRYVIPAHYDMFEGNLENVNDFTDYLGVKFPHVKSIVPEYGKCQIISK